MVLFPLIAHSESIAPENKTYDVAIIKNDFVVQYNFEKIEKELNLKFNYHYYENFPEIIHAMTSGSHDFAGNIIYNEQRAKYFQVSSPTNLVYMFFYSKNVKFNEAKSLTTSKYAHFTDRLQALYPDLVIVPNDGLEEGIKLVESGQVDGVIESIANMELFVNMGYYPELMNDYVPLEPVGIAASFNVDQALLEKMAQVLQTTEVQKHIREMVENYQLTLRKNYIRDQKQNFSSDFSKPIIVNIEDIFAFSEYLDNGEVVGFAVDILDEACDILAFECIITTNGEESWNEILGNLKQNKIDILAPMAISNERKKMFNFSRPFYHPKVVIVKRNNYKNNTYNKLSELIIEKIGVVKDDYFQSILNNALPKKELISFADVGTEIQGLIDGEVDYILLTTIDYNLAMARSNNRLPIQIDDSFSIITEASVGFAFTKTQKGQDLSELFNLALNLIDTNKIVNDYDKSPNWSLILHTQRKADQVIYSFLFFLLLLTFAFLYYQYRRGLIDELTKLHNRRAMYNKHGKGLKKGAVLIYLDINSFKYLNDTYGHKVGDLVLNTLAGKIKKHWKGDAYRIGGDEFVLIDPNPDNNLQELLKNISNSYMELEGETIKVRSSIGFYQSINKPSSLDEAMHDADTSMYEDKKKCYEEDNPQLNRRN